MVKISRVSNNKIKNIVLLKIFKYKWLIYYFLPNDFIIK